MDQEPYCLGVPFEQNSCIPYPFDSEVTHYENGPDEGYPETHYGFTVSLMLEDSDMVDHIFDRQNRAKPIVFGRKGYAGEVARVDFHKAHVNTLWFDVLG